LEDKKRKEEDPEKKGQIVEKCSIKEFFSDRGFNWLSGRKPQFLRPDGDATR